MPIELSDTHCHLEQLDAGALDEAAAAGVTTIVAVAQDAGSMRAVLDLASRFPGRVLPGLGIHPCTVTDRGLEALAPDLTLLTERAADAAVIGETGLDHKWAVSAAQQAEQERAHATTGATPSADYINTILQDTTCTIAATQFPTSRDLP